ncbi:MAG: class II aldolase/adducin family protein [Myxococcota bacterium]|nr:class II aldolase/adducin family protein [Myxococcota bacterium]MDW8362240.1 class II aldolase/adducin family protein [Myxococcales bacterium]
MDEHEAVRRALCEAARWLYERGHNAPRDGNLSIRVDERLVLCTPSARHKGRLVPNDVVRVRWPTGDPLDEGRRPSGELAMHLAIYAARPDVRAVVHAHSPLSVGLSLAGVSMDPPLVPEAVVALGSIPTVPYAPPGSEALARAVAAALRDADAAVLERHGPVTVGRDLDEAIERLEVVEHTARITLAAIAAGGATPMSADEVARLRAAAGRR